MKTIKITNQGQEVLILQELLQYHGFEVSGDGNFESTTHNAVISFQKNNTNHRGFPLEVDGIVGDETWRALIESDIQTKKPEPVNSDPVTLDRIKLIHPKLRDELADIYEEITKQRGVGVRFTQTLRSFADQDRLYAQGRTKPGEIATKARGGQSYHNYGLAVDIVLLLPSGKITYNRSLDVENDHQKDWDEIVFVFKHYGWNWGGDWTGYKDYPHFQKTFGYSTNQLFEKYNNKDLDDQGYVKLDV